MQKAKALSVTSKALQILPSWPASSLASSSFTSLQPHGLVCDSWHWPDVFPSQPLCLEGSSPNLRGFLPTFFSGFYSNVSMKFSSLSYLRLQTHPSQTLTPSLHYCSPNHWSISNRRCVLIYLVEGLSLLPRCEFQEDTVFVSLAPKCGLVH